jgi:threonyl-tRNA synthetase
MKELKMNDRELQALRHSLSHIMAQAVLRLFPGAKLGIGPAIENGFYYDFELPRAIDPESDFPQIEAEMRKTIEANAPLVRRDVSQAEAQALFGQNPFKLELIQDLGESGLSVYQQQDFVDLCAGPHVAATGDVGPDCFRIHRVAGAYWRGDEKRPMLTRIYGLAFACKQDLDAHLAQLEEAERRDHRRLGKELDLFSVHEEAGPGLIYWHPRGGRIRVALENWWRDEHYRNGYEILFTPHIGKSWLWETSGHLGFYKGNMYAPMQIDDDDYFVKPMNCPFHILIYKTSKRSYRELPLRWAELGTVYRYERSGVLHGLMRVRGFTQDDAHIICTPEQIESEIGEVLRFSMDMWRTLGFEEIHAYLATRPQDAIGEPERWEQALSSLAKALERQGLKYDVDDGGGAFYGPKIDLKVKDALGREWQMTTIQFDFNLPERFDMTYVDSDGKEKRPYMVHRALLGSLERFFGVFLEHHAGALPLWLSPEQAVVLPITSACEPYARDVMAELRRHGIRVYADLGTGRLNAKIRDALTRKVPYLLVVGHKEVEAGTVAVRTRSGQQMPAMTIEEVIGHLLEEVANKSRDL